MNTPIQIAKKKSSIPPPPMRYITMETMRVVIEVRIVLVRVSLSAIFISDPRGDVGDLPSCSLTRS